MGAAASIEIPPELMAKHAAAIKSLGEEYEKLIADGATLEVISKSLEEKIRIEAPELHSQLWHIFSPEKYRKQVFVDYDITTGHKLLTVKHHRRKSTEHIDLAIVEGAEAGGATVEAIEKPEEIERHIDMVKELCREVIHNVAMRRIHAYIVSTDGSKHSWNAYETAMDLKKGADHMQILHFYSNDKDRGEYDPFRLKEEFDVDLVGKITKDRYTLSWHEKEGFTTRAAITHFVNAKVHDELYAKKKDFKPEASFLVTGFVGRKGMNDDPTVLGKVSDLALRAVHLPCIIVKKKFEKKISKTFLCCTDTSERSWLAYNVLMTLVRPQDILICLFLHDNSVNMQPVKDLEEKYISDMKDHGYTNGSFVANEIPPGKTISQTLSDYAFEKEADFVCVAPHVKGSLSSVAEHLVKNCKSNLIVIKS